MMGIYMILRKTFKRCLKIKKNSKKAVKSMKKSSKITVFVQKNTTFCKFLRKMKYQMGVLDNNLVLLDRKGHQCYQRVSRFPNLQTYIL